jgi:hypothetical protein
VRYLQWHGATLTDTDQHVDQCMLQLQPPEPAAPASDQAA